MVLPGGFGRHRDRDDDPFAGPSVGDVELSGTFSASSTRTVSSKLWPTDLGYVCEHQAQLVVWVDDDDGPYGARVAWIMSYNSAMRRSG